MRSTNSPTEPAVNQQRWLIDTLLVKTLLTAGGLKTWEQPPRSHDILVSPGESDCMPRGQSPIFALVVSNIGYVIVTVILLTLFNQLLTLNFSSGAEGFVYQLWNVWLLVGAMLGIGDVAVVVGLLNGGL